MFNLGLVFKFNVEFVHGKRRVLMYLGKHGFLFIFDSCSMCTYTEEITQDTLPVFIVLSFLV